MRFMNQPVILFNKSFSDDALAYFMDAMKELEDKDEERVAILINSPGGQLDVLKSMLDYIYHTDMTVTTVATGEVASCGFLLTMAGDYRVAFPGTTFMSHMYSSGARGKHKELVSSRTAQDQTYEFMLNHYQLHTGLSRKEILKFLLPAEDVWLTAEQALGYNIIDELIEPTGKPIGFVAKQKAMKENVKAARAQAKILLEQTN